MLQSIFNWLFDSDVYEASWFGENILKVSNGIAAVFVIALALALLANVIPPYRKWFMKKFF